jgi:hypothetical protein
MHYYQVTLLPRPLILSHDDCLLQIICRQIFKEWIGASLSFPPSACVSLSLSLSLSVNLPLALFRSPDPLHRTTKSAWMGKSSTDSATAVSRKGNEIKYSLELNPKDKERQKLRLRWALPLSQHNLTTDLTQTNGAEARGRLSHPVSGDGVWR